MSRMLDPSWTPEQGYSHAAALLYGCPDRKEISVKRSKWTNPEVPLSHLGLKLAEETGEVISEILEAAEVNWADRDRLLKIEEEAEHVRFIAGEISRRAADIRWDRL